MDEARWRRLRSILERATELAGAERARFVDAECADDAELAREVAEWLAHHREDDGLMPFGATTSDAERAAAGRRVGAWEIVRKLGSGGMGTVWLAVRSGNGFEQRAALKLIRRGMDTDDVLRRFERERALLAQLQHDSIARLIDGGASDDGLPYLVLEYVDGRPIDRWCDEERPALRARVELFLQVCAAVQFAHQHLVVHRDIKPSNILVTRDGRPKLLDFGIAKVLAPEGGDAAELTQTGQRLLTPAYASPEQLQGRPITTASDVYSLGVVLYELLAGCKPFRTDAPLQLVARGAPERPSAVARRASDTRRSRELQGDLDTILLKALAPESARRYASVDALADDLRRWLDGRTVLARPDTATYRLGKFVRRNKLIVGATSAVILALAAGLIVSARMYVQARDARAGEATQTAVARKRLQSALTMASTLTQDVSGQLASIPGTSKVREALLEKSVGQLDELAAQDALEPDLAAQVCWGYFQLAHALGNPSGNNVGKFDEALAVLARCDALLARMESEVPNPGRFTFMRSQVAVLTAIIHVYFHRLPEALVAAERAVDRGRAVLPPAGSAPNGNWLQSFGSCLRIRALTREGLGDDAGALQDRRECLAVCTEAYALAPGLMQTRMELAGAHEALANSYMSSGDACEAGDAWQAAIEHYEQVETLHPDDNLVRQCLALSRAHSVQARLALAEYGPARDVCEAAGSYYESWVTAEPQTFSAWLQLMFLLELCADAADRSGDLQESDASWSRFREHAERWTELDPATPFARAYRVEGAVRLAIVRARQGRRAEALELADATEADTSILEDERNDPRLVRLQSGMIDRLLGECLLMLGESAGTPAERRALAARTASVLDHCEEMRLSFDLEAPLSPAEADLFTGLDELRARSRALCDRAASE